MYNHKSLWYMNNYNIGALSYDLLQYNTIEPAVSGPLYSFPLYFCLSVWLYVIFLQPLYIHMEKKMSIRQEGHSACCQFPMAKYHFGKIISLLVLMIIALSLPTRKWSGVDRFSVQGIKLVVLTTGLFWWHLTYDYLQNIIV